MGWRSVMISRPAKLRREHFSLAIEQEQTDFVPFEDIAVIVLNHREITLTHPVLSADAAEKLRSAEFKEIVVTNTIPMSPENKLPNMTVLSIAPLFGEAIRRIHNGESVSSLFV